MKIKTISLFINTDKRTKPKPQGVEDKRPDYIVSAKIGEAFEEIGAGWKKTTKPSEKFPEGRQYLSVSFKNEIDVSESTVTSEQVQKINALKETHNKNISDDITVDDIPFN